MSDEPQVGEIWQHFKGDNYSIKEIIIANKDYKEGDETDSTWQAIASSDIKKGSKVVIYISHAFGGEYWRSLDSFMEIVTRSRFKKL